MIPVTQTKVVVKNSKGEFVVRGNCYAACIASILEMTINEVPNVETLFHIEGSLWQEVMMAFLQSKGWELMTDDRFRAYHDEDWCRSQPQYATEGFRFGNHLRWALQKEYYLVSGQSVRGVSHICIYQNGKLVHDPHPTREGLVTLEVFQTLENVKK